MMVSFLRRLAFGCLWDHSYVRERGKQNSYWFVCSDCGHRQQILPGQKLKLRAEGKVIALRSRRSWSQVPAKDRLKA